MDQGCYRLANAQRTHRCDSQETIGWSVIHVSEHVGHRGVAIRCDEHWHRGVRCAREQRCQRQSCCLGPMQMIRTHLWCATGHTAAPASWVADLSSTARHWTIYRSAAPMLPGRARARARAPRRFVWSATLSFTRIRRTCLGARRLVDSRVVYTRTAAAPDWLMKLGEIRGWTTDGVGPSRTHICAQSPTADRRSKHLTSGGMLRGEWLAPVLH